MTDSRFIPWTGTKAAVKMTDEAGVATATLTLEAGGADAMVEVVGLIGAEVTISTPSENRAEVARLVGFKVGTTDKGAIVVAATFDGPRTLDKFVSLSMLKLTARQPALIGGLHKAAEALRPKAGSGIDSVTISTPGQPPVTLTKK